MKAVCHTFDGSPKRIRTLASKLGFKKVGPEPKWVWGRAAPFKEPNPFEQRTIEVCLAQSAIFRFQIDGLVNINIC